MTKLRPFLTNGRKTNERIKLMSANSVKTTDIGLKKSYVAPITAQPEGSFPTYGTAMAGPENKKITEALTMADGELYVDSHIGEQVSEFRKCDLTVDTRGFTDDLNHELFAMDYTDGVLTRGRDDTPQPHGFSFAHQIMSDGVRWFEGVHYPVFIAKLGNDSYETAENNIKFGGYSAVFKCIEAKDAKKSWKRTEKFATEAEADLWAQTQLGYATAYLVSIAKSGSGVVSPIGNRMVASAGSLEITFGETPTNLYDDGVDVTASVSAKKYTLSNISANHNIVAVFTA